MERLYVGEIVKAVGGKLIQGNEEIWINSVSIDSRSINSNSLFIPIVGNRYDGHDFIDTAIEKGATVCFTSKDIRVQNKDIAVIYVENTLVALQCLAKFYRKIFDIKVIGVTGSVGKTSTKDMIYSVVSQKYNTLKTEGNFNNEIGLPLTIFRTEKKHEVIILEMGMNHFGEISLLSSIVEPDIAVITNIGMSHIENLGSQEGIFKAKSEIFEFMKKDGLAVLNGDDDFLIKLNNTLNINKQFYSIRGNGDIQGTEISSLGTEGVQFYYEGHRIQIPKPGKHNVLNALAAISIGKFLNIPLESIIKGVEGFQSTKMRMDIIHTKESFCIINDAYNASPDSMKAALDVLREIAKENRAVAILGDMLEMGEFAEEAHKNIGHYIKEKGIDVLITVGKQGKNIVLGALEKGIGKDRVYSFEKNQEVISLLKEFLRKEDTILVKGSRGMRMEEIIDAIQGGSNNA